ncbi:MAG: SDR family NAD(P)-dependent oxidoreductase [Acidiferrobacterales bacterium]|nr:SDR family NAD(P)-dependent oxidoreductase [Acidiferrobacterales bacterium]
MNTVVSSLFDLSGKTALITGASSGIGLHFSHTLAAAGARVFLTARRTRQLQQAVDEIQADGGSASWLKLDVTDRASVEAAFADATAQSTRIDIVVNNAGIASSENALDVTEERWDEVIATNLKGAWLVAQQAGRCMSADSKGGSVINIASILGIRVMGGVAPYAAAKAGLDHLTRLLACEWARFNIRVNAIAPGYVVTDINRDYLNSPLGERARKRIPQRRFGQPAHLDGAILLLASDASSYMTGSTIVVDGGHLQSSM